MRYDKPALSIQAQAAKLKERGMEFDDAKRVEHYLTHIGYYRLSAYWLPFEPKADDGKSRDHRFLPDTTFDQVLDLYIFDRQLRLLVMEAIERIETSVRAHWANALALSRDDPHAHLNPDLFCNPWKHAGEIARIARDLEKSTETFVAHYRDCYKAPFLPPIWAVVETFTFGQLSHWIQATKDNGVKQQVAHSLGLPNAELLESVLGALSLVRNICAHHGRLWNRLFTKKLKIIKRLDSPMIPAQDDQSSRGRKGEASNHIYNYLLVMAHMMRKISPGTEWPIKLKQHIQTRSPEQQRAMGFPLDWEQQTLWQPGVSTRTA